jgi:hypothetical protein
MLDSKRRSISFGISTKVTWMRSIHNKETFTKRNMQVSVRTGKTILCPLFLSLNTPIFASTSTTPPPSGLVLIIWYTKSAISKMNSSRGSTPRIDSDSGGRGEGEATPLFLLPGPADEVRARLCGGGESVSREL